MEEQLVSIIVPVYNMAEVLYTSAKTFINQTYKNLEIIMIDDGSADDSLRVMQQLAAADTRIRVYHQENQGAAGARNTGMSHASGKYYYFPDADDRIKENAVEKLVSAIENTGADMAVCGYEWVNGQDECIMRKSYKPKYFSGKYIRENYDEFIDRDSEYGIYGSMANKLYRAEIIKNNKLSVPKISKSEDEAFNILFLSNAGSVCFIEDVLYYYYMSGIVKKGEKYLKNYIESVAAFKNLQMNVVYNWNRDNKKVLEKICRNLAVNFDIYIQMLFLAIPRYKVFKRYKAVKNVVEVFNNELPCREFEPDFRKYKYLVDKKIIRLCIIEELKVMSEIKNNAK